jgi:hypothetical protein
MRDAHRRLGWLIPGEGRGLRIAEDYDRRLANRLRDAG